ncbi:MAG TPA: hypothetical protein VGI99_06180 [Gemmataceae bacterium]|jgi:hypothetical protein
MTTVLMGGAPTAALSQTPPPRPAAGAPAFLQKRWPIAAILGAFPFLALPVAATILLSASADLLWVYVWLFSMTHFVVTLAIYMRSENLRYFASSRMNIAIFFVIPVAIFLLLDLYHALRIGAVLPLVGLFVLGAIRLIDFNHFNRQSFGVLQLFKARSGIKAPVELKRTENLYFCTLTGLIFTTYLGGGVCPLVQPGGDFTVLPLSGGLFPSIAPLTVTQPLCIGFLGIACCLFAAVAARLHRHTKSWEALGYIGVQTIAAIAAAAFAPLYLGPWRSITSSITCSWPRAASVRRSTPVVGLTAFTAGCVRDRFSFTAWSSRSRAW